jgi:hypothetical protein
VQVRGRLSDPHLLLSVGAACVLLAEYGYRTRGQVYGAHSNPLWLLLEAAIALVGLGYAWLVRERLRLLPVLALTLGFHLLWLALHFHLGIPGTSDPAQVYGPEGRSLLHGHYPRSEYPPAAVVLFTLEAWLDPTHVATANRLLMVPFQLGTVGAIWSLRTRASAWLATLVGVWPMNTRFWELDYDLVPTALLAAGLALALRGRWGWAGLALGVGAAAKWTPALSFAPLALWCLAVRRPRWAARLSLLFTAGLLLFYLPFLAWSPSELGAAYTRQAGRTITLESFWYLPLHFGGWLGPHPQRIPFPAGAPHWANLVAILVQALLVLALIGATALAGSRNLAVALAALSPVLFLLTNRIFSAQYLVLMLAAWAIALALVDAGERERPGLALLGLVATVANIFVFPFILWNRDKTWIPCSLVLFTLSLLLTGRIAHLALACERPREGIRRAVLDQVPQ